MQPDILNSLFATEPCINSLAAYQTLIINPLAAYHVNYADHRHSELSRIK